jgi:RNA polymerase sigma factor (sigma-70 family)
LGVTTLAKHSDLSDAALIARFLGGDEGCFRALYHRHTPRLRMLILRLLWRNEAEADDVVQDAWLAGCRGMHRFRGDAAFATWLATIAVRIARNHLTIPRHDDDDAIDIVADPAPFSPAARIDLERAIDRLPDHQRAILVLHDVEGFTHAEIGTHLGVPVGTSKATLSRARAALRRLLTEGAIA